MLRGDKTQKSKWLTGRYTDLQAVLNTYIRHINDVEKRLNEPREQGEKVGEGERGLG